MEMRFLRRIEGKTKKDKIRNEVYRQRLKLNPICDTITENQMRWLRAYLQET